MRQARLTLVAVATVLALLVAAPAGALAADSVTVTGTVVRDGQPVIGVEVVVSVTGSDMIASTATDEHGAFALDVEAGIGSELQVFATGQTSRSDPDAQGCVRTETPIGHLTATIEALPPAPLTVPLDTVITAKVCTATGTPGPTPRVTPPSTDLDASRPAGGSSAGLLIVLGLLAITGGASLTLARRRA
jgi:hypothetical protein